MTRNLSTDEIIRYISESTGVGYGTVADILEKYVRAVVFVTYQDGSHESMLGTFTIDGEQLMLSANSREINQILKSDPDFHSGVREILRDH